jgi:hypothetical protein
MLRLSVRFLAVISSAVILLSACSSSKNAAVASRDNIKGSWTLNTVTYDGLAAGEKLKITLLDEGVAECLEGSTWKFPNNGNGSYNIISSGAGCTSGERNIVWSYRKEGDQPIFQFKRLTGGVKAKDITDGYRFKILNADNSTMQLQSEVTYQGNPIRINYNFSKL